VTCTFCCCDFEFSFTTGWESGKGQAPPQHKITKKLNKTKITQKRTVQGPLTFTRPIME